jgi:predicted dinucleotide-binding enzyme
MARATIRFIGAGHIGSQVARLAVSHGYAVVMSNRDVPVSPLAGKIVIDTNNSYPQRDGHIPELDDEAKAVETRLLDQFAFDTVDAGPLKERWRIQRDTPGYGPRRTADELRKDLAAAKRYAEF